MDFYDAIVETQVLALKALLNVSTYPKNQAREGQSMCWGCMYGCAYGRCMHPHA